MTNAMERRIEALEAVIKPRKPPSTPLDIPEHLQRALEAVMTDDGRWDYSRMSLDDLGELLAIMDAATAAAAGGPRTA